MAVRAEESVERDQVSMICDNACDGFEEFCMANIDERIKVGNGLLMETNRSILEGLRDTLMKTVKKNMAECVSRRKASFTMSGRRLMSNIEVVSGGASSIQTYDLVAPYYNELVTRLNTYIADGTNSLILHLVSRKKEMLFGKSMTKPEGIIRANPEIQFIRDPIAIRIGLGVTTEETNTQMIVPLYMNCNAKVVQKGLVSSEDATGLLPNYSTSGFQNLREGTLAKGSSYYDTALRKQWDHIFQKQYCQEVVRGFHMPVLEIE